MDLDLEAHAACLYPEVRASWSENGAVHLNCPWLATEVAFPYSPQTPDGKKKLLDAAAKVLAELPLVFLIPERNFESFSEHLELGLEPEQKSETAPTAQKKTLEFFLSANARRPLLWNVELLLSSRLDDNKFDSMSSFTIIRWLVFRSLPGLHLGKPQQEIENDELSRRALEFLLQQSYYITSNCEASLSRGLLTTEQSLFGAGLQAYMREELGHHVFIKRALVAMGSTPDEGQVSSNTRLMMSLLKWCAEHNSFALANCLGFFEMGGYLDHDPLANALSRAGYHGSAQQIQKHFEINKRGSHATIGLYLSNLIGNITHRDLAIACDACEILSRLLAGLQGEIKDV